MKEFKSFADFRYNLHLVPEVVALDVMVRIQDWIMSGGSLEDDYVKQQLKFASKFIEKTPCIESFKVTFLQFGLN